ncbi:MAG: arginine--tRNA ligase [Succinivibrio sp.]|nr:arginine--tRNA ligase [Succinivibrio sp.]
MKTKILNLIKDSLNQLKLSEQISDSQLAALKIESTKDRAHGDFATNAALILAKSLHQAPRQLAEQIVAHLNSIPQISKVEIAGPGFINFFINQDYICRQIEELQQDPRSGVALTANPQTIVVDYSAPNVAKEMAVHHIRSTVIGDACVRVLEFLGNKVIRANHIGDWGTQFGMLIAYLEKKENEQGQGLDLTDFEAFYREAKLCFDEDPKFADKARQYVVQLQGGDAYCYKMWQKLVKLTMDQNIKLYQRLDVTLTDRDTMGESLYNDMLPGIVADLQQQGLAVEDQGALVVYLPEYKNKDGEPLGNIVRKSDGGYLYTTTDLACIKYRIEKLHAQRILYFTDSRQAQHLHSTWKIAKLAGYIPEWVSVEHCPFGMMLGKDGKPFKTRTGGTVKLRELLDEAEQRVEHMLEERHSTLSGEQRAQVIHNIAIGAIKYADLSKNRNTDYIFDWDQMLSFEGNTAPYLQYAYSRICSIFRKTSLKTGAVVLSSPVEEELCAKLLAFSTAVNDVAQKSLPNILCTYLYELSGLFMHFYEHCPILKDEVSPELKASRLTLCATTAQVLKLGLSLLGIQVMEQM